MNGNAVAAFYYLYTSEGGLSTTDVAQVVFDPEGTEELRNAERKVRYYFEEGYGHLTNVSVEDDTKLFSVREDRIWFGVGQIRLVTLDGAEVEVGMGDAMVYVGADGETEAVDIGDGKGVELESAGDGEDEGGVGEEAAS